MGVVPSIVIVHMKLPVIARHGVIHMRLVLAPIVTKIRVH